MDNESTADILNRFRLGDAEAAEHLFARYVERLTGLARSRLSPKLASRTDPEDVVMSAYRSFFVGARDGRYTLNRSGDLWRLLVSITLNKLCRQARRHGAQLRSVHSELSADGTEFVSKEPSPDEVIGIVDELENVLGMLDPFARRVLELRLQDESLAIISAETGRSERTIRRTLGTIREMLSRRLDRDAHE